MTLSLTLADLGASLGLRLQSVPYITAVAARAGVRGYHTCRDAPQARPTRGRRHCEELGIGDKKQHCQVFHNLQALKLLFLVQR